MTGDRQGSDPTEAGSHGVDTPGREGASTGWFDRRQFLRTAGVGVLGAVGGAGSSSVAAAAAGPTVYVGSSDHHVYAIDAADGTERWRFDADGRVKSSPTVVGGTVYVGSDSPAVYALDAADGTEQWRYDGGGYYVEASPTIVDHTVYVGNSGDRLVAIDAADGTERWRFTPGEGFPSAPAVTGGTVYAGCHDGNLYAVAATDGTEQWRFGTGGLVTTSPTAVDGTVYVGSDDGNLYAVDAADGSERWRFGPGPWDSYVRSSATVVDGTVYVGRDDRTLYAIDAADGTERWHVEFDADVRSSPTVAGGSVYVGTDISDSGVYAIDAADGTVQWRFDTGNDVNTCPTVVDDTVYVGAPDGHVYALDAADGTERWRFEAGYVRSSPTVVDDPRGGHSVGSRVDLGTLGHHFEAAGNPPPGVSESPSFDVTARSDADPVSPGDSVTVTVTVENVGTAPGGVGVTLPSVTGPGDATTDVLGDRVTVVDHADDGGHWTGDGWQWGDDVAGSDATDVGAGDVRQPSVTLALADGIETGTYTVAFDAVRGGVVVDTATARIEVTPAPPTNRVESVEGDPVPGAEVDLYVTDIDVAARDPDRPLDRRHSVTADEDGVFELPTAFADGVAELLVTARKGDWFTTRRQDPGEVEVPSDYGTLVLDRQSLFGPTTARTPGGNPFGVVSVWRYLFADDLHVFYVEVTNTNEYRGEDPWKISSASVPGGGPSAGDFLVAFPDDAASVDEDSDYAAADPTGDGGVQVFSRDPSGTSGTSLPEFLHPLRGYTDVPLYAALRDQPDEALTVNWEPITAASLERAELVENRLRKGLSLTGKVCRKLTGLPACGPGLLLDVMDGLTYLNRLLEGTRRTATVNATPDTPVAGGAAPEGVFDAWKSDDASLDLVRTESAVAYQVPVRVETDDPITYSVRTEWARPFNDVGEFTGTATTAPVDVEIVSPVGSLAPDDRRSLGLRFRNRGLEPRTVTEAVIETPTGTETVSLNVALEPGETETVRGLAPFTVPGDAASVRVEVTATDDAGDTVSRTNTFSVRGAGSDTDRVVRSEQSTSESAESGDATRSRTASDGVPGFGVLTTVAAAGLAGLRRLRSVDEE
ncbi:MAG: PQQ-binding-like beta-propeller repeat protein [Halobacteriaceae archaeon]